MRRETLFFVYRRQHGLNVEVARIFNTYGPRMSPKRRARRLQLVVQAPTEPAGYDLRRWNPDPFVLLGRRSQSTASCV